MSKKFNPLFYIILFLWNFINPVSYPMAWAGEIQAAVATNFHNPFKAVVKQFEKKTGHKIQVEIWNGCGISNLAMMYRDFLRNEGLDVLDSKNAEHFNYSKTTILHHRGDINRALVLADILKIDKSSIVDDKNENLFYDLTLIIGKDYIDLPSYRNAVLFQSPF